MTKQAAEKSLPEKRARILTLDLMRGLFLLIIFADHLGFAPSFPFEYFTHSSAAFASAAEGFFVISGMLVGYIYGPRIINSLKSSVKKIWKRAGLLYILSVVFTLAYTVWALLLPEGYPRAIPLESSFLDITIKTLTLQYQFGWADFLARYAVFMAIAPLFVWLVAKRFAWIVLPASAAVWFFWRDVPILQFYTAWQLLFTVGIVLGFYLPTLEKWSKAIPHIPRLVLWWLFVVGMILSYGAVIMWMNVTTVDWSPPGIPPYYLHYFDKSSLSIGRLVFGTVWFIGLFFLFRRFEAKIDKVTGGFLLVFGQNSLFVYSFQAFVIFTLDVFFPAPANSPILINTLIYTLSLIGIYFIVRFRYRIMSHGKNFVSHLKNKGMGYPI